MKRAKIKGYLIVAIQFLCLIFIFTSAFPLARHPLLLSWEIAGLILGIWAVSTMGLGNFNITPDLKKNAYFVTSGPYRLLRHPMYASVLSVTWPLVIDRFTWFRLIAVLILTIDLLIKIHYEEALLKGSFPEYESYMKKSARLIPFIF